MFGLSEDWGTEPSPRAMLIEDYTGPMARWCNACGDHAVLGAVQRLLTRHQLPPEDVVMVSGIGCSSRFPHYMKTYGFHGLHGRAFPVACGIKSRRPELHVFAVTGDGDCCAIGTAHWIHAIRYNMDITVMMFDNNIYGLTKGQTSPTTGRGAQSSTHPYGSPQPPMNPLSVVLGIENRSFVAQTVDWNIPHLEATLEAAYCHKGFSFVRVLQRCPHFTPQIFAPLLADPSLLTLYEHPDGVQLPDKVRKLFPTKGVHDPADLEGARRVVEDPDTVPLGIFYKDAAAQRYDLESKKGLGMSVAAKKAALNRIMDGFQV